MKKLFISYRRSAWPFTYYLAERLKGLLDAEIVVDTSVDHDDFKEWIIKQVAESDAFLLIVSEKTFDTERINDPNDFIRLEVSRALEIRTKPVVMAGIDGLVPPDKKFLPDEIRSIVTKQCISFRHNTFNEDVQRLVSLIEDASSIESMETVRRKRVVFGGLFTTAVLVFLITAFFMSGGFNRFSTPITLATTPTKIDEVVLIPTTAIPTRTDAPTIVPTSIRILTRTATLTYTPSPTSTSIAGTIRTDVRGVRQVYVPSGCFQMGSNVTKDETPIHKVCITKSFWMDESETTNLDFDTFTSSGGYLNPVWWSNEGWNWLQTAGGKQPSSDCNFYSSDLDQPKICVSYYEAEAYAQWRKGRLPTEAEWEYAARGKESLFYPWGNEWNPIRANTSEGQKGRLANKCSYGELGWIKACDMSGNAWEWVNDWYNLYYYKDSVRDDPKGPDVSFAKGIRGGAWDENFLRVYASFRNFKYPSERSDKIGFRVVSDK